MTLIINNFVFVNDPCLFIFRNYTVSDHDLEKRILSKISEKGKTLLIGHVHFIDFTQIDGYEMPLYINLVREPIARLVSWYYFRRFKTSRTRPTMSLSDRFRTFEDCVRDKLPECAESKYIATIVPYFCGQDTMCESGSYNALQRAKQNMLRHYSVVGYMERLEDFFVAIEYMIPSFFTNVTATYRRKQEKAKSKRTQNTKIYPSKAKVEYLKTQIPHEYDFYHFIRSRFDCLMKRIAFANTAR